MGVVLPDKLAFVLDLIGVSWPNVDEDDYRDMARSLRGFADDVDTGRGNAQVALNRLLSTNRGQMTEAIDAHVRKLNGKHLHNLAEGGRLLAGGLDAAAVVVAGAKGAAVVQLGILAAEVAAAQAAAPFTLGLSELGAVAGVATTRTVVKRLLKEAAEAAAQEVLSVVTGPVFASLDAMATDLVVQVVSDGLGAQNGVDLEQTAQAGRQHLRPASAQGAGGADGRGLVLAGAGGGGGGGNGDLVFDEHEHNTFTGSVHDHSRHLGEKGGRHLGTTRHHFNRTRGGGSLARAIEEAVEKAMRSLGTAHGELKKHLDDVGKGLAEAGRAQKKQDRHIRDTFRRGGDRPAVAPARDGGRSGTRPTGAARAHTAEHPRHHSRPETARRVDGDPVDMATGRMVLGQTDVSLPGSPPLLFRRRTESGYRAGRWFGPSWASTADQRLEIDAAGIVLVLDDGMLLDYPRPGPGGRSLPVEGPRWPLEERRDGDEYVVSDPRTGRTWHFTRFGAGLALLRRLSDRNGNGITFDHSADGTPTAITHDGGYRVRVSVHGGRITALHLGDVELVRYDYTDGDLTGIVNSSGLPLRHTYDDRGRVTSWTDRNGHRYAFAYDAHDRCVHQAGAEGHMEFTFAYGDPDPGTGLRLTTATNPLGATTRYLVDGAFRVVEETGPTGSVTRSAWDRHDRLLSRTDPLGRTTSFRYDTAGDLVGAARPDGSELTARYGAPGLPETVTQPDGTVWRQEYDAHGNLVRLTDPTGAMTSYAYDAAGHLTSVTDPLGHTTRVRCDAAGLPTEITDPLGAVTRYTRDAFGRVTAVTDPLGATTRLAWTVEGRLASRTAPDGAREGWEYDGEGNCVAHTDPLGGVTRWTYTPFDRPASRTDPDGTRHELTWDTALRLRRVTNPQGLTWTYDHDAAGRLVAETDFDGRTLGYAYDAAGRLVSRTNGLGEHITYTHDLLGRTVAQDAAGRVTVYTYDAADRLLTAAGPDATVTFERDAVGRTLGETVNGRTLRSAYDPAGRRTDRTTPAGAVSSWSYDAAGRPASLTASGHTLALDHDAAGRETARRFGADVTLAHAWDPAGRLLAQTLTAAAPEPATLLHRAYAYRPDGHLTGITDTPGGPRTFDLDTAGRVTAVHAAGRGERYAYDAAGNQTEAHWPDDHPGAEARGPRTYTGTRVRRAGSVTYEHDAAGRVVVRRRKRLSRGPDVWRYAWDAEDRLTGVTTPDGTRWRYLYDPLGRRTAKQRLTPSGEVAEETTFTWDGPTLAEQTTHSPALPHPVTLTWDHKGLHPLTQTERLSPATPQSEIDHRFFAVVTDLIGTPTELVDESGTTAWHTRSTLWGTTTWATDSTAYTPLRFPGQYFDPESGLHYNVHRHYDPETARYVSPDPLGLAPGPNPVAYVPNPLDGADPWGLSPCERAGAERSAPDFVTGSSGTTQDVRTLGRRDHELVLSGHGGINAGDGTPVTVPEGTAVAMYGRHGDSISDALGNDIELGKARPLEVYRPGERLPDYSLFPPTGLTIEGSPRTLTVTQETYLSELLRPNMGRVHWAACRSVV
ncbi:putative adhesin [Streptomyces sp. I05A-00742]|uniref:putative adhesin n=1 Tax=Streptomyces sp. I05A-00742 TaxID=2732853 RepID=UPI002016FB80|nr:RHS repeat-associated core domain-containing protein [Streptomyces sp. I05A-00742]